VSLLFPERRLIGLAPSGVSFGEEVLPCDPSSGAENWLAAVAALRTLPLPGRKVAVVLSNHFVRYALVPWSSALSTAEEEDAYVRHHFARIHGERANAWALRWTLSPRGVPRLATAVDNALITALRDTFPVGGKARLVSVQPHLIAAYHRCRDAIPATGAWLAVAEGDRACVALHAQRRFRAVENARGEWPDLLGRMRHRIEGNTPSLVLLAGPRLTDTATPAHLGLEVA
jgi:hypothetical protein